MKKLIRICLNEKNVLNPREMKDVKGGRGSEMCCDSDGICAGHYSSCSDSYCEKLYGSGAYCG